MPKWEAKLAALAREAMPPTKPAWLPPVEATPRRTGRRPATAPPRYLTSRQEQLYQAFAEVSGKDPTKLTPAEEELFEELYDLSESFDDEGPLQTEPPEGRP